MTNGFLLLSLFITRLSLVARQSSEKFLVGHIATLNKIKIFFLIIIRRKFIMSLSLENSSKTNKDGGQRK